MQTDEIVAVIKQMCETREKLVSTGLSTKVDRIVLEWLDQALSSLTEHMLIPYLNLIEEYTKDSSPAQEVTNTLESNISVGEDEGLAMGIGMLVGGTLSSVTLSEQELHNLG
jgi:hypothetical protein